MTLTTGKNSVTFKSFGVELAGDLYLPEGFDPDNKYKAIVGASPFPQVKGQIPATYGPEMAARGFIYLGFDYWAWATALRCRARSKSRATCSV
ncbi:MAG: hypothetical protein AB3N23_17895 [Paracoccaceae bacterium]